MAKGNLALRGKLPEEVAEQSSSDEYKKQGDTRKIKCLAFRYFAEQEDAAGNKVLRAVTLPRDTEVTTEQIGAIALSMGEREGLFYTDAELAGPKSSKNSDDDEPFDASTAGEFELAEWLSNEKPTINEVMDVVGDDKDLAQRMLQAEHMATEGDPRDGLVKGLTAVIEG